MGDDNFGIKQTLQQLGEQAQRSAAHPKVVAWAAQHGNDPARMLSAVQRSLFVADPLATEWTVLPEVLVGNLNFGADADDRCVLLAAALVSAGYECRLVAHGYGRGAGFSNCLVEVLINGSWVPCETTVEIPMGKHALKPERELAGKKLSIGKVSR